MVRSSSSMLATLAFGLAAAGCGGQLSPKLSALRSGKSSVKAASNPPPPSAAEAGIAAPAPAAPTPTPQAPASALSFGTALYQADGACGAVTISAVNTSSAAMPVAANHDVTLSSSASTGSFWRDAACSSALANNQTTIAAATSSVQVYYSDSADGTPVLTATDQANPPLTVAVQVQTIGAQADHLSFTNATPALPAQSCSILSLAAVDSQGRVVPLARDLQVIFGATPAAGNANSAATFYSDPACTIPASSTTLFASTTATSVYVAGNGAQTITAKALGATTVGTAAINFLPLSLSVANPSSGNVKSMCVPIQLNLADSAGVGAVPAAALALTLSAKGTQTANVGNFFSTSGCGTPLGASYHPGGGSSLITLYFSAQNADTYTLSIGAPSVTATGAVLTIR